MSSQRKPTSEGLSALRLLGSMGVPGVMSKAIEYADTGWLRRSAMAGDTQVEPVGIYWADTANGPYPMACLKVTHDRLERWVYASPYGGVWSVITSGQLLDAELADPWLAAPATESGTQSPPPPSGALPQVFA